MSLQFLVHEGARTYSKRSVDCRNAQLEMCKWRESGSTQVRGAHGKTIMQKGNFLSRGITNLAKNYFVLRNILERKCNLMLEFYKQYTKYLPNFEMMLVVSKSQLYLASPELGVSLRLKMISMQSDGEESSSACSPSLALACALFALQSDYYCFVIIHKLNAIIRRARDKISTRSNFQMNTLPRRHLSVCI